MGNLDVELCEVPIERIAGVVEQFVILLPQFGHAGVEISHNLLNSLQIVLLEDGELSDCAEEVDQLAHSA